MSNADRGIVIIPTYNEAENLPLIVGRLRAAVPDADVLVVDDGSPDGTGELADRLARDDSRVRVLHRPRKEGLGQAYVAGFGMALREGARLVLEMDADFSHDPEYLPLFMEEIKTNDVVLGSRFARDSIRRPGSAPPLRTRAERTSGVARSRGAIGTGVGGTE